MNKPMGGELTGVWAELHKTLRSVPDEVLDRAEEILRGEGDSKGLEVIAGERRTREIEAELTKCIEESHWRRP